MVQTLGCKVGGLDPFLIELGHEDIGRPAGPQALFFEGDFGKEGAAGDADLRPFGQMGVSLTLQLMVVRAGGQRDQFFLNLQCNLPASEAFNNRGVPINRAKSDGKEDKGFLKTANVGR